MKAQHLLTREQYVPRPRSEVAPFFEDPRNLEKITPGFLGFRILTEGEIPMKTGVLIDYSIKLHGLPMKWRTRIEEYEPGERFIDVQLKGPYKIWHHTHTFKDAPDGGTLIQDEVRYELPLGPLGNLAHALFVKKQLQTIFDHRWKIVEKRFGVSQAA